MGKYKDSIPRVPLHPPAQINQPVATGPHPSNIRRAVQDQLRGSTQKPLTKEEQESTYIAGGKIVLRPREQDLASTEKLNQVFMDHQPSIHARTAKLILEQILGFTEVSHAPGIYNKLVQLLEDQYP
jgi:hypothetical protein